MNIRASITPEQKKRRFRQLAKQERIRTGRELEQEREQPLLPFNECQENRADAFRLTRRALEVGG
jgi:hypothetical protein